MDKRFITGTDIDEMEFKLVGLVNDGVIDNDQRLEILDSCQDVTVYAHQLTDSQRESLEKFIASNPREEHYFMLPCPKEQRYPRVITNIVLAQVLEDVIGNGVDIESKFSFLSK